MFWSRILNGILCRIYSTSIITQNWDLGIPQVEILQLMLDPQDLSTAICSINIFCLSSWESNCVLLFGSPSSQGFSKKTVATTCAFSLNFISSKVSITISWNITKKIPFSYYRLRLVVPRKYFRTLLTAFKYDCFGLDWNPAQMPTLY